MTTQDPVRQGRVEGSMNPALERLTYSVPEVAQIIGISAAAAYRCVRSGEIPSITLGSRIVVPRKALAELLGLDQV